MNKKGAVEFSMTTIIVVIIGVVILAIAIPWITGTLNQAGGLTDAAFDSAIKQLQGDPTPDNPLVLSQDSFTLKRGEEAALVVRYLSNTVGNKNLVLSGDSTYFEYDSSAKSLTAGQVRDWRVVVSVPNNANLGNNFVDVTIGSAVAPVVLTVE